MTNDQVTDEELQLYFNFLMKNYGVTDIQAFNTVADGNNQSSSVEECLVEAI